MKRTTRLLLMIVTTALAGCASAPSRFYTLNCTAVPTGSAAADYAVLVGSVSIPAAVDRPQFTIQDGVNQISISEFNRWAAPLNESIGRVVAGDLAALLGTSRVAATPLANFDATFRVSIEVQRFESTPGRSAVIEAVWVVHKIGGDVTRSGRTVASETVQGESFDALAAAHSRALAKLSGDIAAAIRTEAGN